MRIASERLEFGVLRSALLTRVQTPLGRAEVNALSPLDDRSKAIERIEIVRQTRDLHDRADDPPVAGAHDVEGSLELGEKGVMLEGGPLRAIAQTMQVGSGLRAHLIAHEDSAPLLFGLGASLVDLSRSASSVLRCFDNDGQLVDDASPELGPLRKKVRALRDTISGKLAELVNSEKMRTFLQENYYTIRADRYVLPIKASFKNEVPGIVHDASGSGQTVFIEPQVIVDLGNRLKIAQSEEKEEEFRILSELTERVVRDAEPIRRMMYVIGLVDLFNGLARLANDLGCVPVVPDEGPGFALLNAKHPLLLLQSLAPAKEGDPPKTVIVGNDFGLEAEQKILVITGPNTGGKTVAMKTIGLLALMVRTGMHLPCREGSRVGWYDAIDVAIGDQQSIASNLSTFAAHVQALVGILKRSGANTLVLIDEIAADTDPNQGQALAQAILERLADLGAHTVVTTHFERLKAIPFTDDRFRNAGVGFDPTRLRPTYRLTLDVPQGSSGFDIAQGLGLSSELVERARSLTGEGSQELEALMTAIETRSAELERVKEEAEEARREAVAAQRKAEAKAEELQRKIRDMRREEQDRLLQDIDASRDEVRRLIAKLQSAADKTDPRDAMRLANQTADKLGKIAKAEAAKVEVEPAPVKKKKKLEQVEVGDWVHVSRLGRDGDVVSVHGKDATVAVGHIRMRVPIKTLTPPNTARPKQAARFSPKEFEKQRKSRPKPEKEEKVITEEIDIRGMTVDEGIDRVEAFLDYHYGMATTHVRIIHGLGTGVLRDAIRSHFQRSGYIRELRAGAREEGGDGATIVTLS